MEEVETGDSLNRRSSRKRKFINYKPCEKKLKAVTEELEQEPVQIKPAKKRGRPRKIPCENANEAPKKPLKLPKLYHLNDYQTFLHDFIENKSLECIKKAYDILEKVVIEQRKPIAEVLEEEHLRVQDPPSFAPHPPLPPQTTKTKLKPPLTPMIQPARSIPNNSIIMQGVINTGMSQQSCFLIPIDINNIARFPGGVQMVRSSPQIMTQSSAQIMTPTIQTQPVDSSQSIMVTSSQPRPAPPNVIKVVSGNVVNSGNMLGNVVNSGSMLGNVVNGGTMVGKLVNSPVVSNVVSKKKVVNVVSLSGNSVPVSVSSTPSRSAEPTKQKSAEVIQLPPVPGDTGLSSEIRLVDLAPAIMDESLSSSDGSSPISPPEKKDEDRPVSTENNVATSSLEHILEALQSSDTDSISQVLEMLSQDDIMSLVTLLTTSPASSTSTSDSVGDIGRIVNDIDKISKMDPEQFPNGAISQLASEISKVLSGSVTGGSDIHDDDEDFQHVNMEAEPVASGGSLKCSICGRTSQDEQSYISHMRFHLFSCRYSCYECGYGTSSMNDLLLHKSKDHEGDLTKISPEFLKQLPKTEKNSPNPELDETLIACPECKVNIPLHSLGSHMSQLHKPLHKVTPGRKPKCTICTALVENKSDLAAHVRHHGQQDNLFSCYYCNCTFSTITSLQQHTSTRHAIVASKRHYKCDQCFREFSGSYHLIRHVKTVHEQRRDFQCSKCDKSFVELHCLRRHIRNIHNMVRDHSCPVCTRGFTYRQDMFRHIMSVHQKIRDIKCPLCTEKFYHRYFIGHAHRVHDLKVKYRDGICYIYDDMGNVIHKIT